MFRSQRGPDPFVGEGRLESLLHGPFRRFVFSLSFLFLSAFYDSFLFIVEPESLVHNGPVRGMRAWNRCSSLHPCVSLLLSSLRVPSSLDERRRERKREMKNRRCPSPPFLWNRFFRATVTERCLSFDELASSDLFAPLRYQSLPLVRSRSWADIIRKFASQSTVSGFPFPRWKGWKGQPIFCFVIASQKLGAMPI